MHHKKSPGSLGLQLQNQKLVQGKWLEDGSTGEKTVPSILLLEAEGTTNKPTFWECSVLVGQWGSMSYLRYDWCLTDVVRLHIMKLIQEWFQV